MINRTKAAKRNEKKYYQLLNVVDEVLLSTKNGTESDFFEEIPRLANLVDELTGETLQQRWGEYVAAPTSPNIADVSKLLKHSNEETTQQHYVKK
tara:strand:+ start:230 stop:514 length:285 start_codon:yes stop_codon:yes gene_type:complete